MALGLTMLGLVMLFSAGVVKDAHSLLIKQLIWIVLSVFIAILCFLYEFGLVAKNPGGFWASV